MNSKYQINAKILKALGDPNRVKIIDLLSCGEKCGCEILANFKFTQPTLSHHIKVLMDCGLIEGRKDGIWNQYKLNVNNANKLLLFLMELVSEKENCLCNIQEHNDNNIKYEIKSCSEENNIIYKNTNDEK